MQDRDFKGSGSRFKTGNTVETTGHIVIDVPC